MAIAVIGATGHVGGEVVRGALAGGQEVAALVRDGDEGRHVFGRLDGLRVRPTRLDDPNDVAEALHGVGRVFIAMGSIGQQGALQRIAINVASRLPWIKQVTRVSVLNASADSLGINQRAHDSIDQFATSTAVPYSTVRPAVFQLSLLAAANEVRTSRRWTGVADSGRVALIDHRDVAEVGLRVLIDPALWGTHHDVTGPVPMSWPEALDVLSAEIGTSIVFCATGERQLLQRLRTAGLTAGEAELLITREWALLAGESDYTTDTFQRITGRSPRTLAEFVHEHRNTFV
jgi:uncharacterized protein YbjT (DUF2867 family)